ncbi:hypothetical protein CSUI_007950, partial [Cystoisospora suis]
ERRFGDCIVAQRNTRNLGFRCRCIPSKDSTSSFTSLSSFHSIFLSLCESTLSFFRSP